MLLRFTTLAAATLVTMAHAQKVYEIDPETVDILQRGTQYCITQRSVLCANVILGRELVHELTEGLPPNLLPVRKY